MHVIFFSKYYFNKFIGAIKEDKLTQNQIKFILKQLLYIDKKITKNYLTN